MAGDPSRGIDTAITVGRIALLEHARERKMELDALAREQVVVHRLPEQRMSEEERAIIAGDEHLLGDRLA